MLTFVAIFPYNCWYTVHIHTYIYSYTYIFYIHTYPFWNHSLLDNTNFLFIYIFFVSGPPRHASSILTCSLVRKCVDSFALSITLHPAAHHSVCLYCTSMSVRLLVGDMVQSFAFYLSVLLLLLLFCFFLRFLIRHPVNAVCVVGESVIFLFT